MNTTIAVTDTKENLVSPEVNVITQIIVNIQAASNDALLTVNDLSPTELVGADHE